LTTSNLLVQLAAFAIYFPALSFFEWAFHRYAFHTPKVSKHMFRAHTLVHHQVYKHDDTYHTHDDHPREVPMNWWALPALMGTLLPVFVIVQLVTGIPSIWGGLAAVVAYYGIYESIHWAMHVPRAAKFLSPFRLYRFLDAHHRAHHKYMLSNLNVVVPLADLLLGTLRAADGTRIRPFRKSAPAKVKAATPEATPAAGTSAATSAAPAHRPVVERRKSATNRV